MNDGLFLVEVTFVPVSTLTGSVSTSDVVSAVRPNTVLVTVMAANNETGVLMPVKDIGRKIKDLNKGRALKVLFHSDGAQVTRQARHETSSDTWLF